MFQPRAYRCMHCGCVILRRMQEERLITCTGCHRVFTIGINAETGAETVRPAGGGPVIEPLNLPKGSIRATITMMLALCTWFLMGSGHVVPTYLQSIVLTIIGYYFGFRRGAAPQNVNALALPERDEQQPLFLPRGFIRLFLIGGFVVTTLVLFKTGKLLATQHLQFAAVILGLLFGNVFARFFAASRRTRAYVFFNHLKGAAALVAAAVLMLALLTSGGIIEGRFPVVLASIISFYFGSRS